MPVHELNQRTARGIALTAGHENFEQTDCSAYQITAAAAFSICSTIYAEYLIYIVSRQTTTAENLESAERDVLFAYSALAGVANAAARGNAGAPMEIAANSPDAGVLATGGMTLVPQGLAGARQHRSRPVRDRRRCAGHLRGPPLGLATKTMRPPGLVNRNRPPTYDQERTWKSRVQDKRTATLKHKLTA
jgi:hypothetical protein